MFYLDSLWKFAVGLVVCTGIIYWIITAEGFEHIKSILTISVIGLGFVLWYNIEYLSRKISSLKDNTDKPNKKKFIKIKESSK